MINTILPVLRWSLRLGSRFILLTPLSTIQVVLGTLVSQMAMMLAFFLPLKVIILLGTPGIPRYFPPSFQEIDRGMLILSLTIATVAFYLLYQFAEFVTKSASDKGARHILAHERKFILFENQDDVASSGYQRFSQSLAAAIFTGLTIALMLWLYPPLAILVMLYIALVFGLMWWLYAYSRRARDAVNTSPAGILNVLSSVGFLLGFMYMVADFMGGSPPNFIAAIISLLLLRQMMNRLAEMINDLIRLNGSRLKLNALFFHDHVMISDTTRHQHGIWSMLVSPRREEWITEVLNATLSVRIRQPVCEWIQTGITNVFSFIVTDSDNREDDRHYLVTIFDGKRSSLARNEADLLGDAELNHRLPALELAGFTRIEFRHCHIFRLPVASRMLSDGADIQNAAWTLRARLLSVEPPEPVIQRYKRSHPWLWQRLDQQMIDRLRLAIHGEADASNLDILSARLGVIRQQLQSIPLAITNPLSGNGPLFEDTDGNVTAAHWGSWALDPAGAGWPMSKSDLRKYENALDLARSMRPSLRELTVDHLLLSARLDNFEKLFIRQHYTTCLEMLPEIIECSDLIDQSINADTPSSAQSSNQNR